MGTGFAKKKKEARVMQQKFQEMQEKMKLEQATGTAGNGLVSITLNGEHEVVSVKIKPECVDPEDVEGLEDLIKSAFEDASKKIQASTPNMPGMPNMPF